jgi:hypothetical protein
MRTEPLNIEGLAGPAVITLHPFTGRHSIMVGGRPATGTRRGRYSLPTADGRTVDARLRAGLFDPHPSLQIAGVTYRTGPPVPRLLQVLALAPIVLVGLGGLLGGLIGGGGVVANMGIARSPQSTARKTVLMIVVLVAAVVVWMLVAGALLAAIDSA